MTTRSPDQAAPEELLRDALAEGHHDAMMGGSNSVIETAEARAVDMVIRRGDLTGAEAKLLVLRGLASMLYASEQELIAKVDGLEERIADLRKALDVIERGHPNPPAVATSALLADDKAAAEERAPTSDTEPAPPPDGAEE